MRFVKLHILHSNDSTHRIALGAAVGFFVAWTPALGLHILLVLGLSILLKANKFVALVCVWVCNPFTFVPIYYVNYLLGRMLMRSFEGDAGASRELPELFSRFNAMDCFSRVFSVEFWRELVGMMSLKWVELWVGSGVMSILVGVAAYFGMYFVVAWYRKVHPRRRHLEHHQGCRDAIV